MPRDLTIETVTEIDASSSSEILLYFLVIDHPQLLEPIRVVNDVVAYLWQGNVYAGFPFELTPLTDSDRPSLGSLQIQNVDSHIGEVVRSLVTSPILTVYVLAESDFDPYNSGLGYRPEIGTPTVEMTMAGMELRSVTGDEVMISGELFLVDYEAEPWPYIRLDKVRAPGLFVRGG